MPLLDYWFELTAMAGLAAASAFFSGSEAALFSASRADRAEMAGGTDGERLAATLLNSPERLLTAILFWNLVVNLTYYALTEIVSVRIARSEAASAWAGTAFTLGALVAIILVSEVLPKSLAVLKPRLLSALAAAPLSAAARVIDPMLPWMQRASDTAARLLLPRMDAEPYLELADLERAVELGAGDTLDGESLLQHERLVLQRVVELADSTAADLMRPRRRCLVLPPPIQLEDVRGQLDGTGDYVLVTEPDSDEIAGAIPVTRLPLAPSEQLDRMAAPVAYVPWCASAAAVLDRLRQTGNRVAAVINEFGETIGIVTAERLLDAVLRDGSRVDPDDAHAARLRPIGSDAWEASGGTPLRRLIKRLRHWNEARASDAQGTFATAMEEARSRTVRGLLQEQLDRPPMVGDEVTHGGVRWLVQSGDDPAGDAYNDDPLVVRLEAAVVGGGSTGSVDGPQSHGPLPNGLADDTTSVDGGKTDEPPWEGGRP